MIRGRIRPGDLQRADVATLLGHSSALRTSPRLLAHVQLYQALGGGWSQTDAE
jgi:hypothetical protein